MKPFDNNLKKQVQIAIKNKQDIYSLIENVNINGTAVLITDLTYAIISKFDRIKDKISNVDFSNATIGQEGKITNLSRSKFYNCLFYNTKFLGTLYLKNCECTDCNFNSAHLHNMEYQYTKFINCTFCEAIMRIGTDYGYKAYFDKNFFRDLSKHWGVEVRKKDETRT